MQPRPQRKDVRMLQVLLPTLKTNLHAGVSIMFIMFSVVFLLYLRWDGFQSTGTPLIWHEVQVALQRNSWQECPSKTYLLLLLLKHIPQPVLLHPSWIGTSTSTYFCSSTTSISAFFFLVSLYRYHVFCLFYFCQHTPVKIPKTTTLILTIASHTLLLCPNLDFPCCRKTT